MALTAGCSIALKVKISHDQTAKINAVINECEDPEVGDRGSGSPLKKSHKYWVSSRNIDRIP